MLVVFFYPFVFFKGVGIVGNEPMDYFLLKSFLCFLQEVERMGKGFKMALLACWCYDSHGREYASVLP